MSELVRAWTEGGVGHLRLERVEKRNALSHALVAAALREAGALVSRGVAVAVLEAAGPVFCAGADLDEAFGRPPAEAASERLLGALLTSPLFWVAAVEGPALGAGVAVATACPVSVCADTAWFSLPEIRLGLFPSGVMAYLEPVLGTTRTLALGLRERRWTAREALEWGLVSEVVEPGQVAGRVADWTAQLAAHPAAVASARVAWQTRFADPAFRARKAQLDRLLEVPRGAS
jgi:enoyl-CoA hydratase